MRALGVTVLRTSGVGAEWVRWSHIFPFPSFPFCWHPSRQSRGVEREACSTGRGLVGTPICERVVFARQLLPCLSTRCQQHPRRLDAWPVPS